jgi:hypothetical protein
VAVTASLSTAPSPPPPSALAQRVFSCSQGALNAFAYGLSPGVREALRDDLARLLPCCVRPRQRSAMQQLMEGRGGGAGLATPLPPALEGGSAASGGTGGVGTGGVAFATPLYGRGGGGGKQHLLSRYAGADEDDDGSGDDVDIDGAPAAGILMTPLGLGRAAGAGRGLGGAPPPPPPPAPAAPAEAARSAFASPAVDYTV